MVLQRQQEGKQNVANKGDKKPKQPSLAQRIWEANRALKDEWEALSEFDENVTPIDSVDETEENEDTLTGSFYKTAFSVVSQHLK